MKKLQKGFSILGFLFIASLLGFYVMLVLKLSPVYYEHHIIKGVTDKLIKQSKSEFITKQELVKNLEKKLYIENIETPAMQSFKLIRKDGTVYFIVDYTKEILMMANISALVHFHDEFVH